MDGLLRLGLSHFRFCSLLGSPRLAAFLRRLLGIRIGNSLFMDERVEGFK